MNDSDLGFLPAALGGIARDTAALSFTMASDHQTGALLRTLAASKPGGRLLELGTGTGLATAWLLAGMDAASHLVTVETEEAFAAVARRHLGADGRVTFVIGDAAEYLRAGDGGPFDLVFADAWPGKYEHLDRALGLVRAGGFFVIDDMLPQPNWPDGHEAHASRLLADLENRPDLALTKLRWSTGLVVAAKRS
jgi:predicted O-methyltransferase YrrM